MTTFRKVMEDGEGGVANATDVATTTSNIATNTAKPGNAKKVQRRKSKLTGLLKEDNIPFTFDRDKDGEKIKEIIGKYLSRDVVLTMNFREGTGKVESPEHLADDIRSNLEKIKTVEIPTQ